MSEAIIVALITASFTLCGTILSVVLTQKKSDEKRRIELAVLETKLSELTREVREHNNFARRMPVVEEQITALTRRFDGFETATQRRLDALEKR